MKIILKKDVLGLGYKDEVLTVKDGYGRNYLLPQGYAVLATEKAVKAQLVLAAIAEAEKVEVTDEDIDAEFQKMADMNGMEVEKVKAALPVSELEADIVVKKAIDLVKDSAKVTEEKATKKTAEKKDGEEKAPAKKTAAKKTKKAEDAE